MLRTLGSLCLMLGIRLLLRGDGLDNIRHELKKRINMETHTGSHSETGGHSLRELKPVSDYTTQSFINVLRNGVHKMSVKEKPPITKPKSEFKEKWL